MIEKRSCDVWILLRCSLLNDHLQGVTDNMIFKGIIAKLLFVEVYNYNAFDPHRDPESF